MTTTFAQVQDQISKAASLAEGDAGASPVLRAVVQEFYKKLEKTVPSVGGDGGGPDRESIVELEQAGDSAKAAAEADPNASEETRQAVLDAHLSICMLKAGL
jgi:hypothetical protein